MTKTHLGALQERLQQAYNNVKVSGKGFHHSKSMTGSEHGLLSFFDGMVEAITKMGMFIKISGDKVYIYDR